MYMGNFGAASPKLHRLLSNDQSLLQKIHDQAGYMSRQAQELCSQKLVKKYVDSNGKRRCVGIKDALKESA